jgi:predicted ATPase with chaperone activity
VKEYTCSNAMVSRYQKQISESLLDRIDIHIEVPHVQDEKLSDDRPDEPSVAIQARIEAARERQRWRFEGGVGCCPMRTWGRRRFGTTARWTTPTGACSGQRCSGST